MLTYYVSSLGGRGCVENLTKADIKTRRAGVRLLNYVSMFQNFIFRGRGVFGVANDSIFVLILPLLFPNFHASER